MSDDPPNHVAMVAFGERVRQQRQKHCLTMHGLCREIEKRGFTVSTQELSDVEHGRRWLTPAVIGAMAAVFGVSMAWLRDGPAEEPKTLEERVADLERRLEALTRDLVRRRY